MEDLKNRIEGAIGRLDDKIAELAWHRGLDDSRSDRGRLDGKIAGLRLVLDYMRAYEQN